MKRGDLITYAGPGDYGKPRPALVVQSDHLLAADSVVICLLTSDDEERPGLPHIEVLPTAANGLEKRSLIMVEKMLATRRRRCGKIIGKLGEDEMQQVNAALAFLTGLLDH